MNPMLPEILRRRAEIVRTIRRFFDERDFIEVETAVRIPAPAPEEHIDCPVVAGPRPSFLRASPEIQMKKLLAAGMDRIYQIGPCFRDGEKGSRHNPEFTMIEWYRRKADYLDIKADLEQMLAHVSNQTIKQSNNQTILVRDAYREHAGWDPWAEWDQDRFDFDMATKIEPAIKAMGGGVFLMDYPPQAASLAKLSTLHEPRFTNHEPRFTNLEPRFTNHEYAERWEFYYDGMELANCFTELCDETEQRRRFERARKNRRELEESDYPIDEEFLSLLPAIGSASGVALGVDRLVMILMRIQNISTVRADL